MHAKGKNIAVLLPNHFNAKQFNAIKECIVKAGGSFILVGFEKGESLEDKTRKQVVTIEKATDDIEAGDYDAIIILDSSTPEEMKASRRNLRLISNSFENKKVIGAVDRGVELLVAALGSLMNDHKVTCPIESSAFLEAAGAIILDQDVVTDGTLVTSRSSVSTDEFCRAILSQIGLAGGIAA